MATAKKINEIDATETDEPTTRKRTVRTPTKPVGQARVNITYNAEIEDDKEQPASDENKHQMPFPVFPNQNFFPKHQIKNPLADFFDELKDYGDDSYFALVVRIPDKFTDKFLIPNPSDYINFDYFQFSVNDMTSFVPMIRQLNSNSGGRFRVLAYTTDGDRLEANLQNLLVTNPQVTVNANNNNSDNQMQLLQMFEQMQQRSDEKFAMLLQSLKPEKDRFTELAETYLMKKLTDDKPAEQQGFNPDKIIETVFLSQGVIEAMSSKISGAFDGNKPDEKPVYLQLIESDFGKVIAEKAGKIAENLSALAVVSAQQKQQQQQPPIMQQQQQQQPPPVANPNELTAEQQAQIKQQNILMQDLINDIIEELESENKLDAENEVIQDLKESYPAVYPLIEMSCKIQPFENVLNALENITPETFSEYKDEKGEFTEQGKRLVERLKEFYEFVKTS